MSVRRFTRRLVLKALPAAAGAATLPAAVLAAQEEEGDVWQRLSAELAQLPPRERVERLTAELSDAVEDAASVF